MKNNWQTKKFGEVCEFVRGPFGGSLKKNIFTSSGYAVYEQQHAIYNQFENIRYFIDESKFNEMKRFEVSSGNLIMSCSGTMGKIAMVPEDIKKGIINQALLIIKPNKNLFNEFLKLWMESGNFQESLKKYTKGAAIKNVASVKILKSIEITFPELSEQKRIVKKMDEVFENIDNARQNTERNLQNSKELFGSYLNNIFCNKSAGWNQKQIGDISDIEYGFTDKARENGDFRCIRITDIDQYGNLRTDGKVYIKSTQESENFLLSDDELLMVRTGATFAKVLLYKDLEKSVFASYLIRIKFKEKINNELYWFFSKTKIYWDQANKLSSGSAQPQFNGNALKQLIFSYPVSSNEQKVIVKKLNRLSEQTKKLEENYKQKLLLLVELKKSVLTKAFAGEL